MTAPVHHGLIAGRYQLVAPMGSDETATVYRGLDILLDLEVAVKQLTLAPTADDGEHAETLERTFREARAAARIHHPGVAAVYDVVSCEDSPYIVMQLIKGCPLAELIAEQGPLPPHQVAGIGRQVLAALVAGHVVGVLHGDLKPGNVMITPDRQAVLTHFGIAGTVGDPSIRTGIALGTPGYLAPERASGMPATPAADLWSLGATLYAALCGQGPFDDRDDALATLSAIASEDPPHLAGDGSLYEIVNALLRRDPAWPAFPEIARALDAAAANAPVTASPPAAEAPPPVPPSFGREASTPPDAAVTLVPAASVPTVSLPVAEPPADPAFVPPSPRAHAVHDEDGTARADRRARASLILTTVAGLALVAAAVAVFVPGTGHSAQTPPAPAHRHPRRRGHHPGWRARPRRLRSASNSGWPPRPTPTAVPKSWPGHVTAR